MSKEAAMPSDKTRESETDIIKPDADGEPPRPSTEPEGSKWSVKTDKTATDPGTGAQDPNGPAPPR
jgi:hypothetical protein